MPWLDAEVVVNHRNERSLRRCIVEKTLARDDSPVGEKPDVSLFVAVATVTIAASSVIGCDEHEPVFLRKFRSRPHRPD